MASNGVWADTRPARLEFSRRCEALRLAPEAPEQNALRRGWHYGAEDFQARLLDRLEGRVKKGPHRARIESSAAKAQRIIAERLAELGWSEDDLLAQRKCAPEKIALAERLRGQTA